MSTWSASRCAYCGHHRRRTHRRRHPRRLRRSPPERAPCRSSNFRSYITPRLPWPHRCRGVAGDALRRRDRLRPRLSAPRSTRRCGWRQCRPSHSRPPPRDHHHRRRRTCGCCARGFSATSVCVPSPSATPNSASSSTPRRRYLSKTSRERFVITSLRMASRSTYWLRRLSGTGGAAQRLQTAT